MIEYKASDIHLTTGEPIIFRIDGDISRTQTPPLSQEQMTQLLLPIIPLVKQEKFGKSWDADFAYEVKELGRFRVNLFRDHLGVGAVLRHIPSEILTAEQLGLPEVFKTVPPPQRAGTCHRPYRKRKVNHLSRHDRLY